MFVSVPPGRTFDCSIPPAARFLFNPHYPRFLKASALHDELLLQGWDRVTSGAVFHEALKADGVGRFQRLSMWLAVSLRRYE